MTRRKTRATAPSRSTATWAIIPIDGRPLREKARKEYEKVLRDVEQAREELDRFEKEDKPLFGRWMHSQFGALITQLRETTAKLEAHRQLLLEIESETYLGNCSHTRAYERVMRRRENPEPETEAGPEPESHNGKHGEGDKGADPFAEFFASLDEAFEEAFCGPSEPGFPNTGAPASKPARLKELYRALARRLHPDAQEQMTWQKKEWWHQAQAAYQNEDVDQLQVILTLCEIEEEGTTTKTSVSLLTRITRQFTITLRTLKTQLNQCRRDPAWKFASLRDRTALATRTERMLERELFDLKTSLEAMEYQLANWARQAQTARARRSRRRPTRHSPEFWS